MPRGKWAWEEVMGMRDQPWESNPRQPAWESATNAEDFKY